MKQAIIVCCGLVICTAGAAAIDDAIERLGEAMTFTASGDQVRTRLSGSVDLEAYGFQSPAPGLLFTERENLFTPRLSLFADSQIGERLYAFAQVRVDQGFDPSDESLQARVDEYALRFTAWNDGRLNVQIGQFPTVVGTWTQRHGSWRNPFITAPLPYENLTAVWDRAPADSAATLFRWGYVDGKAAQRNEAEDKDQRLPVIWGPAYTTGASVSGRAGKFNYAAEFKNASVSSRPETWSAFETQWENPTVSGRFGYSPSPTWDVGVSASEGTYLMGTASPLPGTTVRDYRQVLLAQDVSFAWRHFQLWAEIFETRFTLPGIGTAKTVAYYAEAKYKFTPQFSAAVRWNEQLFGSISEGPGRVAPWGRDTWRVDFSPSYRFSEHTQIKLQFSLQHHGSAVRAWNRLIAAQFTLRF